MRTQLSLDPSLPGVAWQERGSKTGLPCLKKINLIISLQILLIPIILTANCGVHWSRYIAWRTAVRWEHPSSKVGITWCWPWNCHSTYPLQCYLEKSKCRTHCRWHSSGTLHFKNNAFIADPYFEFKINDINNNYKSASWYQQLLLSECFFIGPDKDVLCWGTTHNCPPSSNEICRNGVSLFSGELFYFPWRRKRRRKTTTPTIKSPCPCNLKGLSSLLDLYPNDVSLKDFSKGIKFFQWRYKYLIFLTVINILQILGNAKFLYFNYWWQWKLGQLLWKSSADLCTEGCDIGYHGTWAVFQVSFHSQMLESRLGTQAANFILN